MDSTNEKEKKKESHNVPSQPTEISVARTSIIPSSIRERRILEVSKPPTCSNEGIFSDCLCLKWLGQRGTGLVHQRLDLTIFGTSFRAYAVLASEENDRLRTTRTTQG